MSDIILLYQINVYYIKFEKEFLEKKLFFVILRFEYPIHK